jgi:thiamine-monophosphate kinase
MKLRSLRERELISAIRKEFSGKRGDLVLGIGDDAAIIKSGSKKLLLTTDLLIEDVHFIASLHPPYFLGRKALNVNLSDIAAMGGRPKFALLGLALKAGMERDYVREFFRGFKAAARENRTELIGGDISSSGKMSISVTVIGEGEHPIRRSGARPGDLIFVSGTLGDAAAGLKLIKKGHKLGRNKKEDVLLRAFLDPVPQVSLGRALSDGRAARAMIDISDGLSVDLLHLCEESRVGAEVYLEQLPLSPEIRTLEKKPWNFALHGGEDYRLLFTAEPRNLKAIAKLQKRFEIHCIGRMKRRKGVSMIDEKGKEQPLEPRGFEHLAQERREPSKTTSAGPD